MPSAKSKKTWADIKSATVFHMCAAHIIKAVSSALQRKTGDKGLQNVATHVFARMQNTVNVDDALAIFRPFCMVFLARHVSKNVTESLQNLEGLITNEDAILQDRTEDVSEKWEMDENSAKTITGGSPFSKLFRKIYDDVMAVLANEEQHQSGENPYYCPDVITFLLDNYLCVCVCAVLRQSLNLLGECLTNVQHKTYFTAPREWYP